MKKARTTDLSPVPHRRTQPTASASPSLAVFSWVQFLLLFRAKVALMNNHAMTTAKQLFEQAPLEYLVSRAALVCVFSGIFIGAYMFATDKSSNPVAMGIFMGMLSTLTFFLIAMVLISCLALYWRTTKRPREGRAGFDKSTV